MDSIPLRESTSSGADWDLYRSHGAGLDLLLAELSPIRAYAALERFLAHRDHRLRALAALFEPRGLSLEGSDEDVRRLNQWFLRNVEAEVGSRRLLPIWYAVINDLALYLGGLLIARTGSGLRWLFDAEHGALHGPSVWLSARNGRAYVHPGLIVAFPTPSGQHHFRLQLDTSLADYAHAVRSGRHVDPDYFLNLLMAGVLAG